MNVDPLLGLGAGASSAGVAGGAIAGGAGALGMAGAGGSITLTAGNSQGTASVAISGEEKSCMELADYYDVSNSWAQINEAGSSGRKVGTHHKLSYVDDNTRFRVEILNDMQASFFKDLRGRFFTSFRVFVGHPTIDTDKQEIEIMMAYPEAIAKSEEIIRNAWAVSLNRNARSFFKVLYWDLWTWENAEPHYHDMYCALDYIK